MVVTLELVEVERRVVSEIEVAATVGLHHDMRRFHRRMRSQNIAVFRGEFGRNECCIWSKRSRRWGRLKIKVARPKTRQSHWSKQSDTAKAKTT